MNKKKKLHTLNEEIKDYTVRIPEKGILKTIDALNLAKEEGLDLVVINSSTTPIICKIMNYEKFIYEQTKKPKPKIAELKEIKFGPNTSENDLEYRVKHIKEFLKKGHNVKLTMQFRGREMVHVNKGQELMLKMILEVSEDGIPESMPKLEGKKMTSTIRPKPKH